MNLSYFATNILITAKMKNKFKILFATVILLAVLYSIILDVSSGDMSQPTAYKLEDFVHLIDTNNDSILVGDYSGNIYFFNKEKKIQWKYKTDGVPMQLKVMDNKVFIFVEKEESIPTYFLYILTINGKLLNKFKVEIDDSEMPYVDAVLITNNYHLIVPSYYSLIFFDIKNGGLKARYNYIGIKSISLFGNYILANSYDYSYLLNMDGDVVSSYRGGYSSGAFNNQIVTISKNGSIRCFDTINNILSFKYPLNHSVINTLVLDDGIVVITSNAPEYDKGYVYYLKNKEIKWMHEFDSFILDSCLINKDQIAIILSNGQINVISKNGDILERSDIKGNLTSTYCKNNIILVGTKDKIYMLNRGRETIWFKNITSTVVFIYTHKNATYAIAGGKNFIYFFDINGNLEKFYDINESVTSIYAFNEYIGIGTKNKEGEGKIYLFDDKGSMRWNYAVEDVISIDISDKYVVVGCMDKIGAGSIYLFDINGTLKWKDSTDARVYPVHLYNNYVIVGLGNEIIIFDASGDIVTKYPISDFFISLNLIDNQTLLGTIAYERKIENSSLTYRPLDAGHLYFLNTSAMIDASPKWEQQINCKGFLNCGDISMSVSDNYLAVVSEYKGEVYLFNANGTLKWKQKIEEYPISTKQIKIILDKYVVVGTGYGCYEKEKDIGKSIDCNGSLYIFDINGGLQLKQKMGEITKIDVFGDYLIVGLHKKLSDDYLLFFSLASASLENHSSVPSKKSYYDLYLMIIIIFVTILSTIFVIWHKKFKR